MKKIFIPVLTLLLSNTSFSQNKLGEVACVYVTTTNLDSSVALYEKLGLSMIASNTYPVPWAQVSDGALLVMMRKDDKPYIGLTYYTADINSTVEKLEKDSIVFTQKPKPGDAIQRYYFKSPDGLNIMLAQNLGAFTQPTGKTLLTMKQDEYADAGKYPNKELGVFGEFCHPVADLQKSLTFWKKLGFKVMGQMKEPYPHAILSDGLMIIGLHQTDHFNYPAVTYFSVDTGKKLKALKDNAVKNLIPVMGENNVVLKTWEGQNFFIFSMGM